MHHPPDDRTRRLRRQLKIVHQLASDANTLCVKISDTRYRLYGAELGADLHGDHRYGNADNIRRQIADLLTQWDTLDAQADAAWHVYRQMRSKVGRWPFVAQCVPRERNADLTNKATT